ncbi:hypothetical protein FS827_23545 [Agrobacterium vitis]|uniref:hypothetical protein n=1 Tax=Rhizobium/Agrobacterium group TaxID=227290 RepID=UPI0012E964F5|nr:MULTISPECIES: hypothetical protein [Rhizobium/Agrobacterium group]MCF1464275.1 hypothetical protein [Allorhizobium ampelinum]MCF1493984.1 hypothetical protein [Allorhizobium ampelinum]MVA44325.1 hypothetical protein [Agrobacterium vitis]
MVNLAPYFRTYHFEHGLRMLEKGYTAARDSLFEEITRTKAASETYERDLAKDGKWIGEHDDEGNLLWDQTQMFEVQIDDIESALFEVRKAFVIALYHFWEDSVAHWMNLKGQTTFPKMVEYCASQGYGPSPDIDAARCLTNHLKHGRNSGTDWLGQLRRDHSSFLPEPQGFIFGFSEDTLFKVAAAVAASGPKAPAT